MNDSKDLFDDMYDWSEFPTWVQVVILVVAIVFGIVLAA